MAVFFINQNCRAPVKGHNKVFRAVPCILKKALQYKNVQRDFQGNCSDHIVVPQIIKVGSIRFTENMLPLSMLFVAV